MKKHHEEILNNPKSTPAQLIDVANEIQSELDEMYRKFRAVMISYRSDMMREMRGNFNNHEFDLLMLKIMENKVEDLL
jgi:hypothetical protein